MMLYGLVDVGSNTVRLNIYDTSRNTRKFLLSKKYDLGLVSYIEKRKLTEKGIKKLIMVISTIKNDLETLNIEEYQMFATASIRNISNSKNVLKAVKDETGVEIEILSGDTEAKYSFLGSVSIMKKDSGVLIDVGGGSTEIVIFKDKKITHSYSLPIGSLVLYNDYVSLLVPNEDECDAIRDRVKFELKKEKVHKKKFKYMCGVGGSVRAVRTLLKDLNIIEPKEKVINPVVFKIVMEELPSQNKETYKKLLEAKPSRVHTMVPGLLIIQEICDYFDIKELQVSKFGVREGYLEYNLGLGE